MIVDSDGNEIEFPDPEGTGFKGKSRQRNGPASDLPSVIRSMETVRERAAEQAEIVAKVSKEAELVQEKFVRIANGIPKMGTPPAPPPQFLLELDQIGRPPVRPEPELLRQLVQAQQAQNASVTKMAEGIEALAEHAKTDGRRTNLNLWLTGVVVVLTGAIVYLTIELLSRTPVVH